MATIICPKCGDQSYFSVTTYKGPFRCMKCKEVFNISIENGDLKSCQPFSQQELNKLNVHKHYQ